MDQAFINALREITDASADDVLRQSLQSHGWVKEFPAIQDEHGTLLVGNRRARLAKELGIEPVVKTLQIGSGEAADAERFRLAFVSNIGGVPLTAADRKRIAIYLYPGWTQERIAEALGVSHQMVSKYLAEVCNPVANPPARPKGGRPKALPKIKGPPKPRQRRLKHPKTVKPELQQAVAETVFEEGKGIREAAAEAGVSQWQVQAAVAKEDGRREAIAEGAALNLDDLLSRSAKERFDIALRFYKKQLDDQYASRLSAEINQHIKDVVLPMHEKTRAAHDAVVKARKGVMTADQYRRIRACLHPNGLPAIRGPGHVRQPEDDQIDARFNEAFRLFNDLKIKLLSEADMPTEREVVSVEAWLQRKAEVSERRRAERAARARGTGIPVKGPGGRR